jgi:hypothetical protein
MAVNRFTGDEEVNECVKAGLDEVKRKASPYSVFKFESLFKS